MIAVYAPSARARGRAFARPVLSPAVALALALAVWIGGAAQARSDDRVAPVAAAASACSCDDATSPTAFRTCVRAAVRALDPDARRAPGVLKLLRLARRASCAKPTVPDAAVACCLPYTDGQAIVRERMCAALREPACLALGGTALPGQHACGPNPCGWAAADIPVAHTPPGGYGAAFPAPILSGCSEPLAAGAPDLRGMWKAVAVEVNGAPAPPEHPAYRHFERVEQCGDRLVVTAGGVVHDMRCDGTAAHGVHDVAEADFKTPIVVVATYEAGVHVLRPVGIPIEVTRQLDGPTLVWKYVGFTVRLERIGGPEAPPPTP